MAGGSCFGGWSDLPLDILLQLPPLLDGHSLAAARAVCRSWRHAVSLGVNRLRITCIERGPASLQWHELHRLYDAFPQCQELDVRDYPIRAGDVPYLTCFKNLQRVCVSHFKRTSVPLTLMRQLQSLSEAFQEVNPRVTLLVELRLAWASDSVLEQAARLPAACQVTLLHLPSICHDVTIVGLRSALAFTHLTNLKLNLYGACINDTVFASLRHLGRLRQLSFGVVAQVTDAGFVEGLRSLTSLEELSLVNVGRLTDRGVAALVPSWGRLERLSLSKCGLLTNASLHALKSLPLLAHLFLTDNANFCEDAGGLPFRSSVTWNVRECPGLA